MHAQDIMRQFELLYGQDALKAEVVKFGERDRDGEENHYVIPSAGQKAFVQNLQECLWYGRDYPYQMVIEPTNACFMACPGCSGRGGRVGYMGVEEFAVLMEELGPHLKGMTFHNRGDSFEHPRIYDLLRIIGRHPGINSIIHTHANYDLDTEAIVESGGLKELVFSVDGATQESYQHYRRMGKLDLCLENMRKLQETKRKLGSEYPRVIWKFIVMKGNEHEMDLAREMADEIGCDKLWFSPFGVGWFIKDHKRDLDQYLEDFIPDDKQWLNVDFDDLKKGRIRQPNIERRNSCPSVNTFQPLIRWNGDVSPCCNSFGPHANVMGNVFEAGSYKAIWDSKDYRAFRKQAVTNALQQKPCDNCHIMC